MLLRPDRAHEIGLGNLFVPGIHRGYLRRGNHVLDLLGRQNIFIRQVLHVEVRLDALFLQELAP